MCALTIGIVRALAYDTTYYGALYNTLTNPPPRSAACLPPCFMDGQARASLAQILMVLGQPQRLVVYYAVESRSLFFEAEYPEHEIVLVGGFEACRITQPEFRDITYRLEIRRHSFDNNRSRFVPAYEWIGAGAFAHFATIDFCQRRHY